MVFKKAKIAGFLVRASFLRSAIRWKSVRVRFAPSPTGYLHLGGLRTALYNHLFATSKNGTTILRIEDTDQERKVDGAVEQLVDDLKWCGLNYDEGPILQSMRLPLYKENVQHLIDEGHAYPCFCTSTRLDILRREAVKAGLVPRYDNRCRSLRKEDIDAKLAKGTPFCVRFKLTGGKETIHDLVYGEVSQDVASAEGDPIILKTDGFPTYHLANVVDDHDMGITHVLRGVEWQGSTQKHLMLYRAFGWEPPKFAHLPLLLNPDGTKLSKRQGDVDVRSYRDKGLFPLAVVNFVVRAGGGFDIEHWERDKKSFTLKELAEKFDLKKMNSSSCKVSLDKLDASNQLELQRILNESEERGKLVETLQNLISSQFRNSDSTIDVSEGNALKILKWAQHRIHRIEELANPGWRFLWVIPPPCDLTNEEINLILSLLNRLENCSFRQEELKSLCKLCAEDSGVKFPVVMKMLRKVLSGLKEGPSVVEMMDILGKEAVLRRLRKAVDNNERRKSTEI